MVLSKPIIINKNSAKPVKNLSVFENISYNSSHFSDHKDVFNKLKDQKLYTITVIIDNLATQLWKYRKYAKKEIIPVISRYKELLYEYFFDEFGEKEGNEFYAELLDKYRPVWEKGEGKKDLDDYIIKGELESRYRTKILKRFKNLEKLEASRTKIRRERLYNLPEPLNYLDWRNSYDNIFVWQIEKQKYCIRGGSGSSGQRENNSKFIFAFSLINQIRPISSSIYLYTRRNELMYIKDFQSLTVPERDIGSNYHLSSIQKKRVLEGINLIDWD